MQTQELREGLLLLEDGSLFRGLCHSPGTAFGEVVFNTSMTGYQEILTDPSYRRQIVVMTQPHIGNYGTGDDMAESHRPWAEGFIARRFTDRASNHGLRTGHAGLFEEPWCAGPWRPSTPGPWCGGFGTMAPCGA